MPYSDKPTVLAAVHFSRVVRKVHRRYSTTRVLRRPGAFANLQIP